jgi:16S rRNA (guanine527-N7)-methyltransferase
VVGQIRHAKGFAAVGRRLLGDQPSPVLVDLGSGGGLPGLVVAREWPEARIVLLEANGRRATFLGRAVASLGLAGRVAVEHRRAEAFGQMPERRGTFDLVLARSFGPPGVVAECGAPLLKTGGWILVSEPPGQGIDEAAARWPREPLALLGLAPGERIREEFKYRALRQSEPCPPRFPRRNGVPAKRPLF